MDDAERPLAWMETPDPEALALDCAERAGRLLRDAAALARELSRGGEPAETWLPQLIAAGRIADGVLGR